MMNGIKFRKQSRRTLLTSSLIGWGVLFLLSSLQTAQAQPTPQCMQREDHSSICLGDRVIDYRNSTGVIQLMYANATAVVRFDHGDTNVVDVQYLSRQVQCLYGYCINDQVEDEDGYTGYIADLFENGEADVVYPNGETFWFSLDQLRPSGLPPMETPYPWPSPRPFPEIVIYPPWVFGPPPVIYPYPWPMGYPYPYPGFEIRVIFHHHPHYPTHEGHHPYEPYRFPRTTSYPRHEPVPHRGPGPVQVPQQHPNGGHGPATHTGPIHPAPPSVPSTGPSHPTPPGPSHPTPGPSHPTPPSPGPSHPTPPSHPNPPRPSPGRGGHHFLNEGMTQE